VGEGPELAKRGKTKEGLVRKKVGIVLLCNPQGHPLRWEVVEGASAEGPVMLQMMRTTQQVPWLEQIPFVCDRALGRSAYIREMLDADIQFITSLLRPEFDSYGVKLPAHTLADLPPALLREQLDDCTAKAAERARQTELRQLADNLFYVDLGIVKCPVDETRPKETRTRCSEALLIALELLESIACHKFATHAAAARSMGLSAQRGTEYRTLARLDADLQQEVLARRVDGHKVARLLQVASLQDKDKQRAAFAELLREAANPDGLEQHEADSTLSTANAPKPAEQATAVRRVRCVAYFNPEIFARQRWLAETKLRELETSVQQLNERLANPRAQLTPNGAVRLIEDRLRHHDLLNAFEVKTETLATEEGSCQKLSLIRNEQQWHRRRSFDGFTVLVAHPAVKHSAAELCRTYRAKDAVEKDFQVIKSLVKLRPVRHRTDVKVRAHVALCMLALYIQREITARLKKDGISAALAFEQLEPCRLSLYGGRNTRGDAYVLPQSSPEEVAILRRLHLTRLVDPRELRAALTPRSEFVSTEAEEVAEI
jgi:hypothetical protein